jgi:hypothetical protein
MISNCEDVANIPRTKLAWKAVCQLTRTFPLRKRFRFRAAPARAGIILSQVPKELATAEHSTARCCTIRHTWHVMHPLWEIADSHKTLKRPNQWSHNHHNYARGKETFWPDEGTDISAWKSSLIDRIAYTF